MIDVNISILYIYYKLNVTGSFTIAQSPLPYNYKVNVTGSFIIAQSPKYYHTIIN